MNKGYQNLKQLEEATVNAINHLEAAIITEGNTASHQLGEAKAGLIRHINKLAEEQRHYVDSEDHALLHHINIFIGRGFWSRLNWLVTGR